MFSSGEVWFPSCIFVASMRASRGGMLTILLIIIMKKALKCKPSAQFD